MSGADEPGYGRNALGATRETGPTCDEPGYNARPQNFQRRPSQRAPLFSLAMVFIGHRMGQDVVGHGTPDRIPLHAGVPVVDTAEDARVGYLVSSGGEARLDDSIESKSGHAAAQKLPSP